MIASSEVYVKLTDLADSKPFKQFVEETTAKFQCKPEHVADMVLAESRDYLVNGWGQDAYKQISGLKVNGPIEACTFWRDGPRRNQPVTAEDLATYRVSMLYFQLLQLR